MASSRIAVLGSVNMDLVIRAPRLPAPGETISGSDFHIIPGGKGANQAVAAARQGAHVYFIGAVGDDVFGTRLRAGMLADDIDLSYLSKLKEMATGVAMIVLDANGQNAIVLSAGANGQLSPSEAQAAEPVIARADMLLCQLEVPLPAVGRAIDIAYAHGVPVMLNPAPARTFDPAWFARITYLTPNETEASLLTGVQVVDVASARQAAQRLLALGARHVLVTLGAQGVVLADQHGITHEPAIAVQVVDTTGAGDTFVGCFCVAIAQGKSLRQAVNDGQYAAALKVTRLGAQSAIPHRAEVQAFAQRMAAQT
jgi:ribokinase